MTRPPGERWAGVRYRHLLEQAGRSRAAGRRYAAIVAASAFCGDLALRRASVRALMDCLGLSRTAALRTHLGVLRSEALEEADCAYFMRNPAELGAAFAHLADEPIDDEPVIYATLHLGSPVLAYLELCRRGRPIWMIGRPLDAANPMESAKLEWAGRKVAWVEKLSGRRFIGTDAAAIADARARLLAGESVFTPFDVPGDVAARTAEVVMFSRRVRLAAGVEALARLTRAPIRPIVAISRPDAFVLTYGARIEASVGSPLRSTMEELSTIIRRHPEEWWMWPYLSFGGPEEER
jgi:hypothetical protein